MSYNSETRLSRKRQINTLKVFNENVEEVIEGCEYKVKFMSSLLTLELKVQLPPEFPECPPIVICSPPVNHPWLVGDRIANAPGLLNFSPHSDLGMVIQAIRRELEKQQLSVQMNLPAQTSTDLVRSKLSKLTKDELQEIMDNEDAMETFLEELSYPPLENINDNIKSMEENIKLTALANIELQTQIEGYRDSLLCKVEEYHSQKSEVDGVIKQLYDFKLGVDGRVLSDKLIRRSVSNEEESDKIADKFLNKQLPVETFLRDYIQTRQNCHIQKIKADKVKNN